jgi:phosphoserine phosphatase RsbU/P
VLILRPDGTADCLPTPGGLLVGVLPDAYFSTATTVLAPADTLLLHTDGRTGARIDEDRTVYGEEALLAFATAHAGRPSTP